MTDPTVYRTESHFNTIYVLEALPDGDLKTGRELFDSVLLPAQREDEGFFVEFHTIRTPADLDDALAMIKDDCRLHGRGPLLHVEAHGTGEGLQVANGEIVDWSRITGALAEINEACRMNLLVVASMCAGWSLTYSLYPARRCPAFAVIGPPETIGAWDLQEAMKRFYRELITSFDWNSSLEAMNERRPFGEWVIKPATAEILFCRLFREYRGGAITEGVLVDTENAMVANLARQRRLDVTQTAVIRAEIRALLNDHARTYDDLRWPFLMLDLFPENAHRFGLTYEKCFEGAE